MFIKRHTLSIILLFVGILGFSLAGRLPIEFSDHADAALLPTVTPGTPSPTPTASPSPTATATAMPTPTATPIPSPTPTPDSSALDARLEADAALREAICQADMKIKAREGQVVVPILLYHFVGRSELEADGVARTRYNVTEADFDVQLGLLHRLGYETVTIGEVAAAIRGAGTLPPRPVAITVDDGWVEQYETIFPMLQKYEMRATFYIPSTYPVGGRMVTWEQLQEMVDAGMEIGAHTRKHVDLTTVGYETAAYEIQGAKTELEAKLGITVTSLSYPFANYSSATIELVKGAGYEAAVAMEAVPLQGVHNLYRLNRVEIFGTQPLSEFLRWLPWRGTGTEFCGGVPPTSTPRPTH